MSGPPTRGPDKNTLFSPIDCHATSVRGVRVTTRRKCMTFQRLTQNRQNYDSVSPGSYPMSASTVWAGRITSGRFDYPAPLISTPLRILGGVAFSQALLRSARVGGKCEQGDQLPSVLHPCGMRLWSSTHTRVRRTTDEQPRNMVVPAVSRMSDAGHQAQNRGAKNSVRTSFD